MSTPTKLEAVARVRTMAGGQASVTITGDGIETRHGVVIRRGPQDHLVIDQNGDEVGVITRYRPAGRLLFRHYGLHLTHALQVINEKG